jgi:salicylate hydroxylase
MKKIAIIGAGISGLFIANLFKKNPNYQISIYEKNNSINLKEGYGIQLSVNSVKLLNKIGFNELNEQEKFNPGKVDFYKIGNPKKICELDISDFNSDDAKYITLKRSSLIKFLKKDIEHDVIKFTHNISKIDQESEKIKISFEKKEDIECDYLVISDGVFSKSKSLVSNNKVKPKYDNLLAIRGIISKDNIPKINIRNISLFLGSNFHYVVYPLDSNGDLNFIGIIKHKVLLDKELHYSLSDILSNDEILKGILKKMPPFFNQFYDNLTEAKVFPIFVSNDFYKPNNKNIHFIGDAFFAFPPSFAQGASQSIEGAYELFKGIENNTESNFFKNRVKKTKMINIRSKFNQFIFHLSSPISVFFRNIFLKKLVKNKKFLESYLGKIYRN